MTGEEQAKQLLTQLADHLAEAERCVRQFIAVMPAETMRYKASVSDDSAVPQSICGSTANLVLEATESASSAITGKTITVDNTIPEPELIKRWPDGKELWSQHITGTSLCVCADNRYMVSHPSDATEELMERLQEDHGV